LYSEEAIRGQKIVTCGFAGSPMHRSRDTAHACAVNSVAFLVGKRYFLPITWLNLRHSAVKVTKYANWGQGFQKCGLFLPHVRGHVTRRMHIDCFR